MERAQSFVLFSSSAEQAIELVAHGLVTLARDLPGEVPKGYRVGILPEKDADGLEFSNKNFFAAPGHMRPGILVADLPGGRCTWARRPETVILILCRTNPEG